MPRLVFDTKEEDISSDKSMIWALAPEAMGSKVRVFELLKMAWTSTRELVT